MNDQPKRKISVTEARARLSEVLDRVEHGEEILITRRGTPIARLSAVVKPRKPIDWTRLDALRAAMPMSRERSVDLIRRMRHGGY